MVAAMVALSADETLSKIALQHAALLAEFQSGVVAALKVENARLVAEIAELKGRCGGAGLVQTPSRKRPPLPPVPPSWLHKLRGASAGEACEELAVLSESISPAKKQEEKHSQAFLTTLPGSVVRNYSPQRGVKVLSSPALTVSTTYSDETKWDPFVSSTASSTNRLSDRFLRMKEFRRLQRIFKVDTSRTSTTPAALINHEMFFVALSTRDPDLGLTMEVAARLMRALHVVEKEVLHNLFLAPEHVTLDGLVSILWMSGLEEHVPDFERESISQVLVSLRTASVEDILAEATDGTRRSAEDVAKTTRNCSSWLAHLVSSTVVLNVTCMVISLDYDPDMSVWLIIETACACVYVFEVSYWIRRAGYRAYLFTSSQRWWNLADVLITSVSIFGILFEVVQRFQDTSRSGNLSRMTKISAMLRFLRFLRIIRLIKLARSPLIRDLANMLSGFLIGLPSLMWVLLMFVLVLVVFGALSRTMLGPPVGRDPREWIKTCGMMGDEVPSIYDPNCPLHLMYVEEFFGSVGTAMFSCFRFMLADYSTRGGVSLSVTFSQEHGSIFMIAYVAWMIVVIFGLFNIITAIFVDALAAGLKHNDAMRKRALMYEYTFVRRKLASLMERIDTLNNDGSLQLTDGPINGTVVFDQEKFMVLVEDDEVQNVLADLNVQIDTVNLPALFVTLDVEEQGQIALPHLIDGIMRLRGESQKGDVLGCWVSTRLLNDKVENLQRMIENMFLSGRQHLARKPHRGF